MRDSLILHTSLYNSPQMASIWSFSVVPNGLEDQQRRQERGWRSASRPSRAMAVPPLSPRSSGHHGDSASPPPSVSTPLLDALEAAASRNVAAFHFPGHGRGSASLPKFRRLLSLALDLPELPGLDNLFAPSEAIAEAQQEAAELFGAQSTFFLVGGSTCGVEAAVMATCGPGDTLILPRNAHASAFSAMVLSGAVPCYLAPAYDPAWDVAHGVDPLDVADALFSLRASGRKPGAVLVTSPTYFGVCSRVREISDICHREGVPVIVDEAHGGHFQFDPTFPEPALAQSADVVVQSTHKVLTSLTQSAMLHLGHASLVRPERLHACLRMLQSSSPSYLLLASLDAARAYASSCSFTGALGLASLAREALSAIPSVSILGVEDLAEFGDAAVSIDPLRITARLQGLSGFELDSLLCEQHSVIAELPSLSSITFAVGLSTTEQDIHQLIAAFQSAAESYTSSNTTFLLPTPFQSLFHKQEQIVKTPREAFYSASHSVCFDSAVGQISAELICPYPPGIPLLVPGEVITQEALAYLTQVSAQGGIISGATDPSLSSLLVLMDKD